MKGSFYALCFHLRNHSYRPIGRRQESSSSSQRQKVVCNSRLVMQLAAHMSRHVITYSCFISLQVTFRQEMRAFGKWYGHTAQINEPTAKLTTAAAVGTLIRQVVRGDFAIAIRY